MFRLDHKTALVTGAASGIGAAIAQAFSEAGARVFVADRDWTGAESIARDIGAIPIALDVTEQRDILAAVSLVESECRNLDILVNNAGIGAVGNILQTSETELDRLYAVNVRGVFSLCRAFLPAMIRQGRGNIINVASIGGVVGIRDRAAYCTTKAAVVGLTKSLALDHAAEGIRVNCLCPGRVETPFVTARIREYPDPVKARLEMSSTQLFGRMILPREIAAGALYLASDESEMVTGTSFLIDGGWTAGK
jgi:2-keto-3-deoxy-L-fuconate dehydrogenase